MRLDRYIANATGLSRRIVHRHLKYGNVRVDGEVVKDKALHLTPCQLVTLQDEEIQPAQHLYLMLHKPQGTVCANHDDLHPTVIDLLDGIPEATHPTEELQIVGRLDIDTTGLVLLTTDGAWNHKITSPHSACYKTYELELATDISSEEIAILEGGVQLKSEVKPTKPCKITALGTKHLRIQLQEGKYHQVKRMFAAVGNKVTKLHRSAIGHIQLPTDLPLGACRSLNDREVTLS